MSSRLFTLLGVLLAVTACEPSTPASPPEAAPPAEARRYFGTPPDGKLHIYFFDVGQGDAALVVSPTGKTVLVDSGPATAANHLVNRLPELLRKPLDLVVLSHPHHDHYGALGPVLRRVGARRLLEPQLDGNPQDYSALLSGLEAQKVELLSPAPLETGAAPPPRTLSLGDGVELTVLWPRAPADALLNVPGVGPEANSLVLRLTHGDTAVLFAGDAHARTLEHLVQRKLPLKATLLKVPGHGAEGPTTQAFLQAVQPRAALISVGRDRGNEATATLQRLESSGVRVFRTDVDGEVQVVGDGKTLVVTPQRLLGDAPKDSVHTFPGLGASAAAPQPPKVEAAPEPPKTETAQAVPAKGPAAPQGTAAVKPPAQPVDLDIAGPSSTKSPARDSVDESSAHAMPTTGYVASAKSTIFHIPSCRFAKQIKEGNLLKFKTRAEAGKKHEPHECVH
jgi:beta-lactamase superfamily II metal-dependent hydrolase